MAAKKKAKKTVKKAVKKVAKKKGKRQIPYKKSRKGFFVFYVRKIT